MTIVDQVITILKEYYFKPVSTLMHLCFQLYFIEQILFCFYLHYYSFCLKQQITYNNQQNHSLLQMKQVSQIQHKSQSQNSVISPFRFQSVDTVSSILKGKEDCQNLFKLCQPLKIKQLKLLFKASEHDFLASQFHKKCDGIQHTITLVKTNYDKVIGGYTKCKWDSTNNSYVNDNDRSSFLFSLTNMNKLNNSNSQEAIFNDKQNGPIFGDGNDLFISNSSNFENSCYSYIGYTYKNEDQYPYESDEPWKKFSGGMVCNLVQNNIKFMQQLLFELDWQKKQFINLNNINENDLYDFI